jgi:hypothetical protein
VIGRPVQGGRCWGRAGDGEDGTGSGGARTGPMTGMTVDGQRRAGPAMGTMAGDEDDGGGQARALCGEQSEVACCAWEK